MPKRFKLLLCSLFQSCRSKDHLPSQPLRSHRQDANWHVLDGGDTSFAPPRKTSGLFVPPPLGEAAKVKHGQRQRRTRRKRSSTSTSTLFRPRLSTSSTNSCLFSEEEKMNMDIDMEMERETLVSHSSRSLYTDSSTDFSPHLETIREGPTIVTRRKKRAKAPKRSVLNKANSVERSSADVGEDGEGVPARLSAVFQRLMPCAAVEVEGKVRESFAVVKRSDDPYEDFRRSMAEMIVEKEMVEEADLKELLRCFLSLNSEHHHGIILTAFNDIWGAFFSNSNSTLPSAS